MYCRYLVTAQPRHGSWVLYQSVAHVITGGGWVIYSLQTPWWFVLAEICHHQACYFFRCLPLPHWCYTSWTTGYVYIHSHRRLKKQEQTVRSCSAVWWSEWERFMHVVLVFHGIFRQLAIPEIYRRSGCRQLSYCLNTTHLKQYPGADSRDGPL